MSGLLLNPWLVFGSLWLSIAALVALFVWPLFVAPTSDDAFSDYEDYLLALGDLTSPAVHAARTARDSGGPRSALSGGARTPVA